MKLTWQFDEAALRSLAITADAAVGDMLRVSVRNACEEGAKEARDTHQYKDRTGALTNSIDGRLIAASQTSAEGQITAGVEYASYVEEGTPPHVIRPKNARFLRFVVNGQVVFARKVNHPGTKPHPFMGQAYLKAERVLQRDLEVGVARVKKIVEG